MSFKLVLKGFKLKKVECWAKRMAQPVQPVDRLCSSGRGPVEGGQKVFLSPSGLFFLVKVEPQSVEVRSRSCWGPVEAQWSPAKHLMLTASRPLARPVEPLARPVEPLMASLAFFFYKKALQSPLFHELNLPKSFLIIFEPWNSIFECTITSKLAYL